MPAAWLQQLTEPHLVGSRLQSWQQQQGQQKVAQVVGADVRLKAVLRAVLVTCTQVHSPHGWICRDPLSSLRPKKCLLREPVGAVLLLTAQSTPAADREVVHV